MREVLCSIVRLQGRRTRKLLVLIELWMLILSVRFALAALLGGGDSGTQKWTLTEP